MNIIRNLNGKIIGFKCFECGKIVQSMWGDICNSCRARQERHNELIKENRKLAEEIKELNKILINIKNGKEKL
jgi:hypothetical protein